jgi:NitT/TauT family transport system substrate-binding protein
LVEYGGLDAKAKDNPKAFYSNDYLPKGDREGLCLR